MDVNSAWKSTCSLLLGGEIGDIDEYKEYLCDRQYVPYTEGKSVISGKKVVIGATRYGENPKVISQNEIDYHKKLTLNINEIKDIDSLMESLKDRFHYAGNKIFGNSKFYEDVDNCSDSFYTYKSHTVFSSKYVGYSIFIREGSEYVFGCGPLMNCKHVIRGLGAEKLQRCFEFCNMALCSDMYYTSDCIGCSECMFTFNQRSKRYCIGNLELSPDKYRQIKKKLLGELREYLKKNKSLPSLFDFHSVPDISGVNAPEIPPETADLKPVEEAFRDATNLVFGVKLGPIDKYAKFLRENIEPVRKGKTPFGNDIFYSDYYWSKHIPEHRMIHHREAVEASKLKISIEEDEEIDLKKILDKVSAVAFYPVTFVEGDSKNCLEVPMQYMAVDSYHMSDCTRSKKCSCNIHCQNCDSVFGSGILMVHSSFCIRCQDCYKNNACLEMDSCKSCTRSMFCHNCENLQDSMFCFNTKNKKYAVGNVEIGREKYMEIRAMVLKELLNRLEEKGTFGFDVCNLG